MLLTLWQTGGRHNPVSTSATKKKITFFLVLIVSDDDIGKNTKANAKADTKADGTRMCWICIFQIFQVQVDS